MPETFDRFVRSLGFFTGTLFKEREIDILFYYPAHFNRDRGKNPFFEPLYELCKKHGISYLVLEEPYKARHVTGNNEAIPFDYPLLLLTLLRKATSFRNFPHIYAQDRFLAKFLKPVLFRKLRFRHAIVLSNSMISLLKGLDEKAKIYDYQHGVIFAGHKGYFFEENAPARDIRLNEVTLLVHGKGFRDMLIRHDRTGYYKDHVEVLGYHAQKTFIDIREKKQILFSLQFTGTDEFGDHQEDWLAIIDGFFRKNSEFFLKNDLTILLKKHPRHDERVDISRLFRYPFTKEATRSMEDHLKETFVHLTFYSSSLFDASSKSIPTLLWQHDYSLAHTFVESFRYPLGVHDAKGIIEKLQSYLNDDDIYKKERKMVGEWYDYMYRPLDSDLFLDIFQKSRRSESEKERS